MRTLVTPLAFIVGAFSPALGQTVQGTWKPIEVVVDSGPDRGRHTTDVQPGLLIFTKGHYSMMFVMGFTPRAIPSDSATKEQIGLLFLPFTANAGTYQRKDSTIIFSPSVAKHPAVMAGQPFTMVVRVKGDTLWTSPVADGPGMKARWVRVERQ